MASVELRTLTNLITLSSCVEIVNTIKIGLIGGDGSKMCSGSSVLIKLRDFGITVSRKVDLQLLTGESGKLYDNRIYVNW